MNVMKAAGYFVGALSVLGLLGWALGFARPGLGVVGGALLMMGLAAWLIWEGGRPAPNYLGTREHWEVSDIEDFSSFFGVLHQIMPPGSALCLDGFADAELRAFLAANEVPRPPGCPDHFRGGRWVPVTAKTSSELQALAERHAEPEIAIHLCVSSETDQLLEWFDVPDSPLQVSPDIPERAVRTLCEATGAHSRRVCPNQGMT